MATVYVQRGRKASPRRVRPIVPHPTDPGLFLVELTQERWAIVDAIDAVAAGQFNWSASARADRIYAERKIGPRGHVRTVFLHQFVAERMVGELKRTVDHENGNGLDCRRMNLRPATQMENLSNRGAQKNSASGIKGVVFDGTRNRWVASVKAGATRRQGRFKTAQLAAEAVVAWRKEMHGEFANHGVN